MLYSSNLLNIFLGEVIFQDDGIAPFLNPDDKVIKKRNYHVE